jgi:hypothetical protein
MSLMSKSVVGDYVIDVKAVKKTRHEEHILLGSSEEEKESHSMKT